jgi:hypothetical protein
MRIPYAPAFPVSLTPAKYARSRGPLTEVGVIPEKREPDEQDARRPYEPPEITVLGTLAELTAGVVPTTSDGVLPGSIL